MAGWDRWFYISLNPLFSPARRDRTGSQKVYKSGGEEYSDKQWPNASSPVWFTPFSVPKPIRKPIQLPHSQEEPIEMPSKGNVTVLVVATLLAALLAFLPESVADGSAKYLDVSSPRKAHYCGAKLSDTLAKLCNRFNGYRKKSENYIQFPSQPMDDVLDDVEQLDMLQDRSAILLHKALMTLRHLNSQNHSFRRVRRQVVAECCYQSCTLETLKSYCAD